MGVEVGVGGGVKGGVGVGVRVGAAEQGEKYKQTVVRCPPMVQRNWAVFARDTVRDLVISFVANLGSARLSAYMDRNAGGLTASSVVAIVALVASVTNNASGAALVPYCPHTTGIASPGVNYVQPFFYNTSDYDGHTFPPPQSPLPLRLPLQTLSFRHVILPPIQYCISLTRQLF